MPQGTRPCRVEDLLEHTEWVRRLALSLVRCESAADDLVQQTFLTALEHPPQEQGATRGWLARVMRNIAIDRSRRQLRRQMREDLAVTRTEMRNVGQEELLPAEIQMRLEVQELMASAVKGLPEPYRTVVVLHYFDEMSAAQIARKLKMNASTVRNQLSRAREQVRAKLEGRFGDQWAMMCVSLLLKPFSTSGTLLPVGWSSILKPLAGAIAVTAGIWLWQSWVSSPATPGTDPSSAIEVQVSNGGATAGSGANRGGEAQRTATDGALLQHFGIEVIDTHHAAIEGVFCRVYALRKPIPPHELLGPEALWLASFPVLGEGTTSSDGRVDLELALPTADGPEPQLCVVASKAGLTERAVLFQPSSPQRQSAKVQIQLHPGVERSFQVVDESSRPIVGARLMPMVRAKNLRDPNSQAFFAISDDVGATRFASLHPQVDLLKCWAPGFLATQVDLDGNPQPRDPPQLVVLKRGHEADLNVHSAGEPYAGARVFLRQGFNFHSALHGSRDDEGYLGETDENGYLRVSGMDPRLRSDLIIKIGGVERRVVSVEKDGQYQVDFPAVHRARGRILQADGTPASHALIMVVDPLALSARHLTTAWSKPDGSFEMLLKEGKFAFAAIHPGGTLLRQELQSADHDLDFGDLYLPAMPQITVSLQDPDGNAISAEGEIKLLLNPEVATAKIGKPQLLPFAWPIGLQTVLPFQLSNSRFLFRHLPIGEYWLRARAPGFCETRQAIQVLPQGGDVVLTMQPALTADFHLIDSAERSLSDRQLELSPADFDWRWKSREQPRHPRQRPLKAYSDDHGRIQFDSISPGTWRLALPGFAAHGQFLGEYQIHQSGSLGAVQLPEAGTLTVTTQSPDQVIADSVIQILPIRRDDEQYLRRWRGVERTNGQGSTAEMNLVADRYRLIAMVPQTVPRTTEVEVLPGASVHHRVELQGQSIHGRLPAGAENGQVLLVERLAEVEDYADEIHRKMRKAVRHPPTPGLGGMLHGTHGNRWQVRYATTQPSGDGSFSLHHLPDGDYWLMASANGYRIAGPFDLRIQNGEVSAKSLNDELDVNLQPGAGFRIFVSQLLDQLVVHPSARLTATIEVGLPLDGPAHSGDQANRQPLQLELKPSAGAVFEMNKDRPRNYQITFNWQRDGRAPKSWSKELSTQAGVVQDLVIELPE